MYTKSISVNLKTESIIEVTLNFLRTPRFMLDPMLFPSSITSNDPGSSTATLSSNQFRTLIYKDKSNYETVSLPLNNQIHLYSLSRQNKKVKILRERKKNIVNEAQFRLIDISSKESMAIIYPNFPVKYFVERGFDDMDMDKRGKKYLKKQTLSHRIRSLIVRYKNHARTCRSLMFICSEEQSTSKCCFVCHQPMKIKGSRVYQCGNKNCIIHEIKFGRDANATFNIRIKSLYKCPPRYICAYLGITEQELESLFHYIDYLS